MSIVVMENEGTSMDSEKRIVDLEARCLRLEEQKTKLIGEVMALKARNESLKDKVEKSKDTLVKMEDKLLSEQTKWKEEKGKIGEEFRQLDLEKKILNIDLKAAEAEVKRLTSLLEQSDGPVTNLLGKIEAMEMQNSKLESDLEAAKMRSQELEKALSDLKSFCGEEDGSTAMLGRERRKIRVEKLVVESDACEGKMSEAERIDIYNALEAEKREMEKARKKINELSEMVAVFEAAKEGEESDKRAMEDEHKNKVLELTRSIEVLEGEKREVEARLIQATKDYRDEIKQISYEKIAAEAEKRAMKDKSERELSEKACKIEVLEWENRDMEVEVSEARREKNEEIKRILNEMAVLKEKHEKENLELVSRVQILELEKKEVEDKACQEMTASLKEKHEKIEEIKRILNENAALKAQHDKKSLEYVARVIALESDMEAEKAALKAKNLELVATIDVLKKKKRKLETQARKNDGVIKVLVQKNECAMTETKRTKMVKNECIVANLEEDVQLPHQVYPLSNAGMLGTLGTKNQGHKSVDLSIRKPQRQKQEDHECSVSNQVVIKRNTSGSVWTTPQQLLNAFATNDELCMRSICTLYRKHKSLGRWKNCLRSSIFNNGFMPPYEARGMNLGELLTQGDPEGRMKMSLAEFRQADPRLLQDCRLIACDHYKLLFEIYSHNLDPLFQSSDDIY